MSMFCLFVYLSVSLCLPARPPALLPAYLQLGPTHANPIGLDQIRDMHRCGKHRNPTVTTRNP